MGIKSLDLNRSEFHPERGRVNIIEAGGTDIGRAVTRNGYQPEDTSVAVSSNYREVTEGVLENVPRCKLVQQHALCPSKRLVHRIERESRLVDFLGVALDL